VHERSARHRRRLFRATLAAAVGVAILGGGEALLRVAGVGAGAPGGAQSHFVPVAGDDREGVVRLRPERVGALRPSSFTAHKPPGTFRVFCLGGSSVFGFPYAESESFCARLESALEEALPHLSHEAINCGGMSYGSGRVLGLTREVLHYEPDALVVYTGHNEYVEHRFHGARLEVSTWKSQVARFVEGLRLTGVLRQALSPLRAQRAAEDDDFYGVGPLRDDSRRLPRTVEEDREVAEMFARRLREIEAAAAERGVPLILIRPGSNLRDWAPEASSWGRDLTAEDRARRDTAFLRARRLAAQDDPDALVPLDEVLEIDPGAAEPHYLVGRLLEQAGRIDAARTSYTAARDLDGVPIRVTTPLEQAIGALASQPGVIYLDAQAALESLSPSRIVGHEMVLDYCHPTREGHGAIAGLVLASLRERFWPQAAGFPGSLAGMARAAVPEGSSLDSAFGAAWVGQMLLRQARTREAEAAFREAIALDPSLATAHEGLGRALAQGAQWEEAARELETAVRLRPDVDTGWNNLGGVYLALGRDDEAVEALQRAVQVGGGRALARLNLARALVRLGRDQEAEVQLRAALEASPSDPAAWTLMGGVLAAQGDAEGATEAYEHALTLDPGHEPARRGLGELDAPRSP
jgi:Flp pilus assembly protein TadD